ncbi:coiled-coil domain-containing protein 17-like [Megalops cyprinoides]|uniref:coiled-coil domain-containing protein 17-like n=1 Tax=Megalops cyprinoides TaxID=118141 RepID=UPI0018643794|nr:coiled-coil domain-containing protein 17-like [Megalops cyprinoides]
MDCFRCSTCNMTFKTMTQLDKHEEKFCVKGILRKSRESDTPQDMIKKVKYFEKSHEERREEHEKHERKQPLDLQNPKMHSVNQILVPDCTRKIKSEPTCNKQKALWIQEQDAPIRDLAKYYGMHVADSANENRKQQREIDLGLQKLIVQTKAVSKVEKVLLQMKAQEQRNALLVESLIEQLQQVQMDSSRGHCRHSNSCLPSTNKKEKETHHSQIYIPVYGGGPLRSEISALRLFYLQNGGNNQLILAQLKDMLDNALHMEMHHGKLYQPPLPQRDKTRQMEKQRLQEELKRRRRDLKLLRTAYTYPPIQQMMKTMKTEIGLLRQEMKINRLKQIKTLQSTALLVLTSLYIEERRTKTPTLSKHFLNLSDGLGPAPYDPIVGFVVFYDFLLGLSPMYRACRLVVGLYSGDQEMASPSSLPLAYCEPASLSAHVLENKKGNLAMLATKQAVPRVYPSPVVSIVLELQASGGYNPYGQEVTHLVSRGWVKVDVFDSYNHVNSGRWKAPIRILPVKPSVTTREMNAIPQLDNAELYLRIVNAKDADVQSSTHIDHSNAFLYKYPPLFNHLAYTESVDPPPPSGLRLDRPSLSGLFADH